MTNNAKVKRQKAKVLRKFLPFCFVFVFLAFSFNLFAQTSEELIIYAQKLRTGSSEEKRDILFEIRNLQTAEASRVAIFSLKDSSEIIRATAAFSVISLPSDEAVQVLTLLLQDKSLFVRRETAYALGKTRNPQAVNSLLQILQRDKEIEVRNAAAIALGDIGNVSAVDALTRILQRNPKNSEEFLRRSAARSIGQIAHFQQFEEYPESEFTKFSPENSTEIKKPIHQNLIESFPIFRVANEVLIKILQNPKESADTRREAAAALGGIGNESSIRALQINLNSEDYYLVEILQTSLDKIRNFSENETKSHN